MRLCRVGGPQEQSEYALFRDDKICPLGSILDDAPVGEQIFDFDLNRLPSGDAIGDDAWVDRPAKLLPPTPLPEKVFCIGLNYRDHAIETNSPIPSEPVVFSKFNTALIGEGHSIELPPISNKVDYEAELVVVIGRRAKNVAAAEAMGHVFGFTCGHDVSSRDWQKGRPGGQWLLGKTFDTFGPVGPCVVTSDELPDPSNLRVQMELNGEMVQDSTTAQLIFDVPTIIAHLSQFVTLKPGDLIFTGTPPGVGDAKDPPVYLQPGDRCRVIVEGVGALTNTCV